MNSNEKSWSVYFQNPDFLERSRMLLIHKDLYPLIRNWCSIEDGVKILDVGCGTGFFTRLITGGTEKEVTAIGLDIEEPFIRYARNKAKELNLPVEFVLGDALCLPFDDNSFDIVTSHTFFTNICDPAKAISEMKRVVKPGGLIASVTPMSLLPSAMTMGNYPEECSWYPEFIDLFGRIYKAYFRLDPVGKRAGGVKPSDMPRFFADQGLRNICAYPIGKVFSLSNAAVSEEDKKIYLALYQSSEEKKLDAFMALPEMADYISPEEAERFRALIREKCEWHLAHPEENSIWEWQGGVNLLLTGRTVP